MQSSSNTNAGGLFHRTPEKYETRALEYERAGKTKKAMKYREKAARLRSKQGGAVVAAPVPVMMGQRDFATYERNALKWEQRNNWTKAQKNREKAWRLQNPQHATLAAPMFYQQNRFVGYNVPVQQNVMLQKQTIVQQGIQQNVAIQQGAPIVHSTTYEPIVQTTVRPTIVQQTTRVDHVTQIQPVIHREIEQPEVHIIEKHMYETVPSTGPSTITRQAIVQETVRPSVIEEIQPVVHRSVPAPFVERVEEHINEHVVGATTTTRQVVSEHRNLSVQEATSRGLVQAHVAPVVSSTPIVHSTTAAAVVQNHERAAIVEQTLRPERVVEVQPVIHREIEQPEVHLIEKHSYEQVRSTGPSTITKQAIIEESIRPRIIEEIQPVIHREVGQVQIERVEQHVTEHTTLPAIQTKQVTSESRTLAAQALPLPVQERSAASLVQTTTAPVQTQVHERATIVENIARPEKVTQVQPIIHREIEQTEVHVVEKHMYESVPSSGPSMITKQAIVEETVKPTIIQEIQPVIHRNVPAPFVERVEEHITEHVVQPTITTKQVVSDVKPVGFVAAGGPAAVAQTTTTTTTTTTAQQGARRV